MKTTVLLVTHAVSRLSYSDYVLVLDSHGQIAEQGTFAQLKTSGGYVQKLDTRSKSETASKTGSGDPGTAQPSNLPQIQAVQEEELDAITAELSRQVGDFGVYKHYFATIGWWHTTIFLGMATLYGTSIKFSEFLLIYCKFYLNRL